ncbi:MAG TPA: sulfite exporter TauE/SafE family protein [Candidatus Saccharimonadales bacterium]|nr:sulfite exporter TauE/SafE family protein [Candidatus Saccharimonadales bacterium]
MEWLVFMTFGIALGAGVLSGMSGGGGGFIMMPYYLFIGLQPANALATAKMGSLGTAFGALTAFKGKGLVHKGLVYKFMTITIVCSLVAAWTIPRIDPELFQKAIGAFLILLIPTLFVKKAAFQPGYRSKAWVSVGFVLYTIFSLLQTIIGTGMGSILVLILMFVFGLGALESNATKRVAQTAQAVILFVLLAVQGFVVWTHGAAALAGSLLGSHIGTHIAIKKGAQFVKLMLAVIMLSSGIALLI